MLAIACLGLAGCLGSIGQHKLGPVARMLPELPDECGVAATSDLIGKDFVLLADRNLVGALRVIWPGQEITADIAANRLNVQVTAEGRIKRAFCG